MSLEDRTNIDNYKPLLADYLSKYHGINNLKKAFNCLNPSHEDRHPSMMYTEKYHICKCFSCEVWYDIFDLIGIDYGVENFKEKLDIASKLYPNVETKIINENIDVEYVNEVIDYTSYFERCQLNIDKTNYLDKRGIEEKLVKKFGIGYDEKRDMIVFPINKNCYFGRGVNNNLKLKSKGISHLWNEELLKNSENNFIYVTESIIDSLSLLTIDNNIKTIALNGLPNYKRLLKVIEENKYQGYLVLAFDNDKTGLSYQQIVSEELTKLNVGFFNITLINNFESENCKDLNEALIKDKEKLKRNYKYFDKNMKQIIEKKNLFEKKNLEKGSEIEL